MEEKGSGMQRSVALALLQVYAEELVKHPDNTSAVKPFFLFIDEPELCLHPQAQMKLLESILKLSKTKQIFIATHSPYFFKNQLLKNIGLFLFAKGDNQKIKISSVRDENWGIFPWSPSWGEINYYAYNLPTVEFHNELYGYLQELSEKTTISDFDTYLKNDKNITETKDYQRNGNTQNLTLCSYIRNQIHHPENTDNVKYTDEELRKSVEILVSAVKE